MVVFPCFINSHNTLIYAVKDYKSYKSQSCVILISVTVATKGLASLALAIAF